jgi:predicted MFS family arabinose efflux permease
LFAILGFLMVVLVATKLPNPSPSASRPEMELGADGGKIIELVRLALRPRVFLFLLEVIIMGAGMATVERLLFLYLMNDLQASTLLCGLSVGINVLFELPIFWYAEKFMKVLGHDGMFIVAMTCFVFRLYGYTLLSPATKWLILVLEIMHGVTFACFWIVCTDISKVLIHQTEGAFWKTAIPSSVQMLYSAFGVSVGSIAGGYTMNKYGSRVMYIYAASFVGVTLILHIIGSIGSRLFCSGGSLLPDFPHSVEGDPIEEEETEGLLAQQVEPVATGSMDVSSAVESHA